MLDTRTFRDTLYDDPSVDGEEEHRQALLAALIVNHEAARSGLVSWRTCATRAQRIERTGSAGPHMQGEGARFGNGGRHK